MPGPLGHYSDRSKAERVERSSVCRHIHSAQQDMPDNRAILDRNDRNRRIAGADQLVDQIRFGRSRKCALMHSVYVAGVGGHRRTQAHHTVEISGASSAFMPTTL
jgi:hypothetical protein